MRAASPEDAGDALVIEQLTEDGCTVMARPRTRGLGLSLADRACLALAIRLAVPAFTADRMWADAGVEVRMIR